VFNLARDGVANMLGQYAFDNEWDRNKKTEIKTELKMSLLSTFYLEFEKSIPSLIKFGHHCSIPLNKLNLKSPLSRGEKNKRMKNHASIGRER